MLNDLSKIYPREAHVDLYPLDREHFEQLVSTGFTRDGDYHWSKEDLYRDNTDRMVYRRVHVSGVVTFWVIERQDVHPPPMRLVHRIPVLTLEWRYV